MQKESIKHPNGRFDHMAPFGYLFSVAGLSKLIPVFIFTQSKNDL